MSRFRMSHLLLLCLSLSVALPTLAAQAADPCTQLQSDAEAAVEAYIETHGDLPRSYEAILALEDPVRKLVMSRLPAEVHYQFWQQHFDVLAEVEMSDAQKVAILAVA